MDLERLLAVLHEADVRFVIVGGVAATIHGSSRLTSDLDVIYARDPENLERLVSGVQPLEPYLRGAPPGLPFRFDAETLRKGLNFTLTTTAGPLDLLGEVAGLGGYENALQHSVEVQLFGKAARCLDLEALLRAKRAAGRPRDLETIAELEAIREESDR
jgi:predicted nucleotidyltransferase